MTLARIKALVASRLDGDRWEVLSSTIISLADRVFGAGAQFAFVVMLGRLLGAQGMGLYVLALSVCTLASVLGRCGMDLSILRFVAVHRGQDHRSGMKHGWKTMIVYACILSTVVAAVLFLVAPYVAEYVFSKSGLTAPLRWMALSIVPFAMLNLLAESLRAVKRIAEASLVQAALLPGFCIILFWLLSRFDLGIEGAVLAYVISTRISQLYDDF